MHTAIGTDLACAAEILRAGGLVAIPTETVYGLAADALDEDAVLRIYEAKQRPRFNPLILHTHSFDTFRRYASDIPEACLSLAEAFCPGPLTFLLPKRDIVPELVTAGSSRVALRVPDHPVARELLQGLDGPLAAPSANPSGYVSPVTARHVMEGLEGRIPYILDGGPCRVGLESTIVSFSQEAVILHRHGAVTAEAIHRITGMAVREPVEGLVETPGQLKSHYAPRVPLQVCDVGDWLRRHGGERTAVISFQTYYRDPQPRWSRVLSPSGDLHEAARNLFHAMRELDTLEADLILAETFPDTGLGKAINDRLERAQTRYRTGV
ncbi:MAG: threonylcarbamoyl-AMP synthase [Chitinophagia bacterium]|nr:threonylcarbamoyl-AMP synthase [Chitinophagia bacterium]